MMIDVFKWLFAILMCITDAVLIIIIFFLIGEIWLKHLLQYGSFC